MLHGGKSRTHGWLRWVDALYKDRDLLQIEIEPGSDVGVVLNQPSSVSSDESFGDVCDGFGGCSMKSVFGLNILLDRDRI